MLLTIGIPTYNRAAAVLSGLHELLAEPASELVEILVIDDGGTDDTHARLLDDPTVASRVRVLRNDVNLGYPGTFARVFAECRTEYLMLMADDDLVVAENLPPLLDYLERERPAFVSPQFLSGSGIYRGRTTTQPVAASEFLDCSGHAPGLVYRVEDCREALAELASRVASGQADALVYPQVVVVVNLLIAARKCEWLALATAREGSGHPSGILDADGHSYWSVESRWRQLTSFDSMMVQYAGQDTSGVAKQLLDAHRARVFDALTRAMRGEHPALWKAFNVGAARHYAERAAAAGPTPAAAAPVPSRSARLRSLVARLARRTRAFLRR